TARLAPIHDSRRTIPSPSLTYTTCWPLRSITPTLTPADSATPPIAVAQDSDGATNSRWYREDGALTEPQPKKSPRSMAFRSHVASGTARTAACVNAGP